MARRVCKAKDPLISFPDGKPIPLSYMTKRWRRAVAALGLGSIGFTLHSLRRGGARYLQDQGASPTQIASHAGWKSGAMFDYIRPSHHRATYAALKALS